MPDLLPTQLDAIRSTIALNMPVPRDRPGKPVTHLLADRRSEPGFHPVAAAASVPPRRSGNHARAVAQSRQRCRTAFDLAMHSAGITPRVIAEVDDMAMLRLMARDAPGVTLVPTVVVRDELVAGAGRALHGNRCVRGTRTTPSPPAGAFRTGG